MLPGSRGFELTWQVGGHRDKPGLLATQPGAALVLTRAGPHSATLARCVLLQSVPSVPPSSRTLAAPFPHAGRP